MTPEATLLRKHRGLFTAEAERKGLAAYERFVLRLHKDIRACVQDLEHQADKLQGFGEELLTALVAMQLRRLSYDQIETEPHSRGHVDLKVRSAALSCTWIAEAKKWKSLSWLSGGMRELLERYLSGRQKDGGFLVYVFTKNAYGTIERWRKHLKANRGLRTVSTMPGLSAFELVSTHRHNSGHDVKVVHFGADLHYSPPRRGGTKNPKGRPRRHR